MQRSHGWRLASLLLITLGLYGCPPEPADPPAQPDASMEPGGAGGAGAAGGAGGQGGAGAAGGAGGAGAAGGAGGAGAAGGEGGQGGAGGGAGGQGGAGAAGGAGGAGAAGGEGGAGGGAPECRRPVDCPAPGAPNCVATCEDGVCGIQCADACDCPAVYDPVCGADGNTYGNACEAACARVEVASRGECADGCVCPAVYDPVCGVDGNTYGNACEAACREVAVAAPGECQDDCVCPAVYDPVCGADGNTYGNACEAACARVRVVSEGECRADCPDPEDPAVMYHFDNPEECAEIAFRCAPGHTAFNDECGCGCIADPNACEPVLCELFCEFGFQVDRNGCEICACNPGPPACRADADCPAVPLPGCRGICEAGRCGIACEEPICPDPADPAVEYLSDDPAFCARAFFECAPGQRAFNDACGCGCIGPIEPEPCACPAIYDPVCGADGRTWGNACEAACARVEVIHPGECRPAVCPDPADPEVRYVSEDPDFCARARFVCEDGQRAFNDACGCGCVGPVAPDPCACPDLWDPVCGVDGNTYGNPCEARCRGVRVAHPGECRAQVCPDPAAPGVRYVSEDPAECAVIRFFCEPGERAFSDACGCGCIGEAPACGRGQIQVEGRCEQLCYGDDGCARGQRCNAAEVCLPDPGCPMCAVCAGWCEALPIE